MQFLSLPKKVLLQFIQQKSLEGPPTLSFPNSVSVSVQTRAQTSAVIVEIETMKWLRKILVSSKGPKGSCIYCI